MRGRQRPELLLASLRKDAETALASALPTEAPTLPLSHLLHELRVQEIELEMQADTLRVSQVSLEEARDKYADLFEFAPVGYLIMTLDGQITTINLTGADLLGTARMVCRKKRFSRFVAVEDRHRWEKYFLDTVRSAGKQTCELRLQRGDGTTFPAKLDGFRVTGETGPSIRITLSDITDLKQAQSALRTSEEKFRLLAENSADCIFWVAPDQRVLYIAPVCQEMFGYAADEFLADPLLMDRLIHPDDHQTFAEHRGPSGMNHRQDLEFRIRHADGQIRWLAHRCWPVYDPDGKFIGRHGVNRDVSEAKRTAELAAANRAKSAFLANMSHEIRTPLNAVLGFAQIGMRESHGRKIQEHFARILDSGQGLLEVIDDILDTSKLQAGRLILEHTPMVPGEIIDRSLQLVTLRAQAKGLILTVREATGLPVKCLGDPGRLRQVLTNLLTNAVKFTPAGGSVTLTAASCHGELIFTVSDTGIGIASEDVERLFQPFEQADSATNRRFGGTGLGLSISRHLVDLMGGTLSVQSVPGQGSHFTVRLPLAGEVPAPPSDDLVVLALRLPAEETQVLNQGFRRCGVVADLDHLPDDVLPGAAGLPTLVVMDGALLETAADSIKAALGRGVKLAAVLNPGHATLTERWADDLMVVERPLRCRHLRRAPAKPAARSGVTTARLAGLVVLAAEDNEVNRLVLDHMLRGEGAEVILCDDGQQALERLRQSGGRGFDVLLTDIQMPGMDGYALARAAGDMAPDLPVIGLTAHAMAEDRESCLAAGMVEHVSKPVEIDHLAAVILRHVAGRDQPPQIDRTALRARYGDRRDFLCRLVETVKSAHGDTAARLREAAAAKDLHSLRTLAHTVKGSAGNLHAERLRALAAKAEQAARDEADDAVPKARTLADAVDDLLAELKLWQD